MYVKVAQIHLPLRYLALLVEETLLNLKCLPEAVEGVGRQILTDTIFNKWSTFKLDELSELVVDINAEGWLELISSNGTVVELVELFDSDSQITFKNLIPASYTLRWLGDPNGNGGLGWC